VVVRDRPQFELYLQRSRRRCEAGSPRIRGALCARRQRPQGRQPGAHYRPIDRHDDWCAYLGRPFRRRARRHLRLAGPGGQQCRRRHRAQAPEIRNRAGGPQTRGKPRRLRSVSARLGAVSQIYRGRVWRGCRSARACADHRSLLRARRRADRLVPRVPARGLAAGHGCGGQ